MFSQLNIPRPPWLSRNKIFVFLLLFFIFLVTLLLVFMTKQPSTEIKPQEHTPSITIAQTKPRPIVADAGSQLTFSYSNQTNVMTLVKKGSGSGLPPIPGAPRDEKNILAVRVDGYQNGKVTSTQWINIPEGIENSISFTVNVPAAYTDEVRIVNRQGITLYQGQL